MASRIFYAVQQVGFATIGTRAFTEVHGLQSVGINTTFNLEQVFELGQISLYENIENTPDIEVTTEKVLDGYPLVYHWATKGATAATLAGRANIKTIAAMSIFDDAQDDASGTPVTQVTMSGLATSNLSFAFPSDGNFTESVTLVGNDKVWNTTEPYTFSGQFTTSADEPLSIGGSGGVNRREDILFGVGTTGIMTQDANSHMIDTNSTILPGGGFGGIPGISSSGTNNKVSGFLKAHIANISVSVDLGREELFELGRKTPYDRFVGFPVEVTTDIETISVSGDLVDGTEDGAAGNGNNVNNKSIRIATDEGTRLNLGTKNKLQSVTYGGGDAGGGNVAVTFSYSNFNDLIVTHWNDPTTALAPAQFQDGVS